MSCRNTGTPSRVTRPAADHHTAAAAAPLYRTEKPQLTIPTWEHGLSD